MTAPGDPRSSAPRSVEVRPAATADIEALATIWVKARRVAYRGVVPDADLDRTVEDRLPDWRTALADPPGATLLVATRGTEVVGFAWFGAARDSEEPAGELYLLYIAPSEWSSGVGGTLLARATEALSRDFEAVVLWTLEANARARRFYERRGWTADGGRKLSPFGDARLPEVRYRAAPRPPTR